MTITVNVDGRPLELDVQSEDEKRTIRIAVSRINELITEFRKFKIDDREKILMMSLLEFAHQTVLTEESPSMNEDDNYTLKQISEVLERSLQL